MLKLFNGANIEVSLVHKAPTDLQFGECQCT